MRRGVERERDERRRRGHLLSVRDEPAAVSWSDCNISFCYLTSCDISLCSVMLFVSCWMPGHISASDLKTPVALRTH